MIAKAKNTFLYFLTIQLLLIMPSISYADNCSNNWKRPSSQTMETEVISATLTEYANGERYFSMKTGTSKVDIYYLRGALLVKGFDDDEINDESIFLLPLMFAVPIKVVSQAVPKGPCSITQKTSFELPEAEGEISPSAQGMLNYKFISVDRTSANIKINHISGTMQFTPPLDAPSEDSDVRGYKIVGPQKPYPVIGGSYTTLGALRRALKEKKSSPKP